MLQYNNKIVISALNFYTVYQPDRFYSLFKSLISYFT